MRRKAPPESIVWRLRRVGELLGPIVLTDGKVIIQFPAGIFREVVSYLFDGNWPETTPHCSLQEYSVNPKYWDYKLMDSTTGEFPWNSVERIYQHRPSTPSPDHS